MPGKTLSVPEEALAGEIEFAIAYVVACYQGPSADLIHPASGTRRDFAASIAAMLLERAGKNLSGMSAASEIQVTQRTLPGRLRYLAESLHDGGESRCGQVSVALEVLAAELDGNTGNL